VATVEQRRGMKSSIPGPVGDLNAGRVLLEVEVRDEVETGREFACLSPIHPGRAIRRH
jgi:hypothetical protein